MTPVGRFRAELEAGMRMLTLSLPDARIQLITIPDVYRLWSLFRGSVVARTVWDAAGVCQSLLARPRSTAEVDQDRRARVRARTRELNAVLADVCGRYVHCRHDAGAVFDTEFSRSDVSLRDFFHPSRAGQAKLAEVAWRHTFDFRDALPPVSLPLAFPIARGTSVVLSAVDDRGVAGIEYRLARARWTRYTGPVVVPTARALEYRAVDVNGNTERSRILVG